MIWILKFKEKVNNQNKSWTKNGSTSDGNYSVDLNSMNSFNSTVANWILLMMTTIR